MNPESDVAFGAAIQGQILGNARGKKDKLDFDIGFKTSGEDMEVVIPKNTNYPISLTRLVNTQSTAQNILSLEVYQGTGRTCTDNKRLANINIKGVKSHCLKGSVEVTFKVDKDKKLAIIVPGYKVLVGKL
jgi:molecular chaperone DnaK (HSP70)